MRGWITVLVLSACVSTDLVVLWWMVLALRHGGKITLDFDHFHELWVEMAVLAGLMLAGLWAFLVHTKRSG